MALKDIITLLITIATFLFTVLIPTIIMWRKAWKKYKAAKTEAEKQAAYNEIRTNAQTFIIEAESLYKDVDSIMKGQGKTCGAFKKESVMTKIQGDCIAKGVEFIADVWSSYIDEQVKLTRKVNAKSEEAPTTSTN